MVKKRKKRRYFVTFVFNTGGFLGGNSGIQNIYYTCGNSFNFEKVIDYITKKTGYNRVIIINFIELKKHEV